MNYLKQLHLINFKGYKELHLDFTLNGKHNPFNLFFAPNGYGKTTILDAIRMLSYPRQFENRINSAYFNKLHLHSDYNPTYQTKNLENDMKILAEWSLDGKDEPVLIESSIDPEDPRKSVSNIVNTIDNKNLSFFVDADNPAKINSFQLDSEYKDKFLDIANAVYGYKVELSSAPVVEYDPTTNSEIRLYTDLVIQKHSGIKVHYKSMSAGEKKIASMLAMCCSTINYQQYDIFLIDNFSMHIYFKRHPKLVDMFFKHFADKQLIVTDHSGNLIEYVRNEYGVDHLYDLEQICPMKD